jgi:DNA modification methylase
VKPYYEDEASGITIYCADCRDVLPLQASLVLTDPPYGISLANHAVGKERSSMDWTIHGDGDQSLGVDVIASLSCPVIAFASPMKPWPGIWRQHLVWEKGEHVSGGGDPATCWKPSWELIQVRATGILNGARDGAVLRFPADKEDYRYHPTPKPLALLRYLIQKTTDLEDVILDPFMGSGSVLVAAKQMGRKAIGVEIEERYCQIAVERLRQSVLDLQPAAPEPTQECLGLG